MRKKAYTEDCGDCDFMQIGNKTGQFTSNLYCSWGKSKSRKILIQSLGKKALKCKFKR